MFNHFIPSVIKNMMTVTTEAMIGNKKWFTCAPKRFKGNHLFFSRDSGLLCKAFQAVGVECKAILPGPPMDDDQAVDLIRTDYSNLEDAEWWRELGGEGVVFYGWGAGRYAKIAQAIRKSGMFLVSHMDTGGLIGIFNGPLIYGRGIWRITRGEQRNLAMAICHFLKQYVSASTVGLYFNDYRRATHLREANVIGAITPIALERIKKVCRHYGGGLEKRVQLIPHPIPEYMRYDQKVPKEKLVVAIGRWNQEQVKGTSLLASTIVQLLAIEKFVKVEIYGVPSNSLKQWHKELPDEDQVRVKLKGRQPNRELRHALQRASISLCTSMRESFHIASGEALCSGASVVGPDIEELPGLKWFTKNDSGSLAPRTARGLAEGVASELRAWGQGKRDPQKISESWTPVLHSSQVVRNILNLFDSRGSDKNPN